MGAMGAMGPDLFFFLPDFRDVGDVELSSVLVTGGLSESVGDITGELASILITALADLVTQQRDWWSFFSLGLNADRHVGQRNIAVVPAASPAQITLNLDLGWHDRPGTAEVDVVAEPPGTMEWLQLYAGNRNPGFRAPCPAGGTARDPRPAP
jgi:hypothetical protein